MRNFTETAKQIELNAKTNDVNLIYPFIEVKPKKKLSVTGKFDNLEEAVVNGAGNGIAFDADKYYYGLSPVFGADEVCKALKSGAFAESGSFEKFIDEHADLFTVPADMKDCARALFAKTLVKMSTMFGHKFECKSKECYEEFVKIAEKWAIKDIDYDTNEEESSVRLLGQPNREFIDKLNEIFSVDAEEKLVFKCAAPERSLLEKLSCGQICLVKGKGYYSGVLPRVKKFEWRDVGYSNSDVMSMSVIFGRSTFATMDAFDGSYIKNHRLLREYVPIIEKMDAHEDMLINKYFGKLTDDESQMLDRVNAYLSESYTAHNLAVSGNITTTDGYLLLCKRGAKTIDVNTYYCSINGQSEICDPRVGFYKQSVYEDMPTLRIDGEGRIDFMGELARETNAELNIFCHESHWRLCGISFLAIKTADGQAASNRRFHFNILAECNAEYSLSQVIEAREKAVEKFENSKIVGFKIKRYKNIFSKCADAVKTLLAWLLKSKDFITSVFALAIFGIGFNELWTSGFSVKSLSSVISVIYTALSLVVLLKNAFSFIKKRIKRRTTHKRFSVIGDCDDFYGSVHCALGKKKINLHPIADVMLYEYIKHTLK